MEDGINYNEDAPFDKNFSEDNSYTGCTATATSQVIYYHLLNNFQNDLGYEFKMDVLTGQEAPPQSRFFTKKEITYYAKTMFYY